MWIWEKWQPAWIDSRPYGRSIPCEYRRVVSTACPSWLQWLPHSHAKRNHWQLDREKMLSEGYICISVNVVNANVSWNFKYLVNDSYSIFDSDLHLNFTFIFIAYCYLKILHLFCHFLNENNRRFLFVIHFHNLLWNYKRFLSSY